MSSGIKSHQFTNHLQIGDEEDMFASSGEKTPDRSQFKELISKYNLITTLSVRVCEKEIGI